MFDGVLRFDVPEKMFTLQSETLIPLEKRLRRSEKRTSRSSNFFQRNVIDNGEERRRSAMIVENLLDDRRENSRQIVEDLIVRLVGM